MSDPTVGDVYTKQPNSSITELYNEPADDQGRIRLYYGDSRRNKCREICCLCFTGPFSLLCWPGSATEKNQCGCYNLTLSTIAFMLWPANTCVPHCIHIKSIPNPPEGENKYIY